jgi:GT2 family glycosyltransferase/lipopolysaccharide/colanic/teichoic acid biosynthesis glycosyltransferase
MSNNSIKISVVIVSYNVRDFLLHSLQSINKALEKVTFEIIVVDNSSVDGSAQAVRKYFPIVDVIENDLNTGFSAANNVGIQKASGEYIVLINPDTLVQEDTFLKLIEFMDKTLDAGGATCKILNPDGTFSIDSRHSVPKPSTALWKFLGLNRLFPKNKIFGRYNLTYLNPDETYPVDAISGSFMFLRKKAMDEIGLMDEDYFMYCEDIDYCYRLNISGWKIYYVPESSIIHYKGESTKKTDVDYVINFNKSLYLFYKKHFHKKSFFAFSWLIIAGAILRAFLIYIKNFLGKFLPNIVDLLILNIVLFFIFYFRFEYKSQFLLSDFKNQYININIITSIIFIGSSYFFNLYERYKISFSRTLKTNFLTFFIVSAVTFFLRDFAFSRLVVVIAAIFSPIFMMLWRLIGVRTINKYQHHIFSRKTLLIGTDTKARQMLKKIKSSVESKYNIVGFVSEEEKEIGNNIDNIYVVTHMDNISEFCRMENISQIIFSSHNISYEKILRTMTELNHLNIEFKIIPEKMDLVIGKSSIEKFDEIPLIDMDYAYGKTFNKILKRVFDLIVSSILMIFTLPFFMLFYIFSFKNIKKFEVRGTKMKDFKLFQNKKTPFKGFINFCFLNFHILKGKISFVGARLILNSDEPNSIIYKPGLMGLVQLNSKRNLDKEEIKKYDLYYLKNQNLWLDFEITFRSIFSR